ncbi:hypothetical protein GCM10017783_07820 [Deinococcus piscis]|uniref:Cell division protein FtsL n=1 Tax=Deinococcus piscis TaxID=394230 RepID=A0ABQ3K0V0_9DEIO|nr:hypothetical protein [Deinococcus piscis]GHF98240.1 hypothetical protein GCM10017783_07820 [Deinococcus piscis]
MTALPGKQQTQVAEEGRMPAPIPAQQISASDALPQRSAARSRWTDEVLWRRWALRLLAVWALLSLALVGLRIMTASIRPELREAQIAQEALVKERDTLSLEVQSLGNASRITAWAEEQGMLRFADSLKRTAKLSGVEAPKPVTPTEQPLKLGWQWGAARTQDSGTQNSGTQDSGTQNQNSGKQQGTP